MNKKNTAIKDLFYFYPKVFNDERGYFFESYKDKDFDNINFIQDNESKSKFGVLRGIHFQKPKYEQSKLVRVIYGKIQDIAVDLRPKSSTYKQYFSIILDDQNKKQIFIPRGFGHAFLTLSSEAIVSYKVDQIYSENHEDGIKYDDPSINIQWELNRDQIVLSEKDNNLRYL